MLDRIGVEYLFVRTPNDMQGVDAVILPGGESTTQWKFLVEEGLDKTLLAHATRGRRNLWHVRWRNLVGPRSLQSHTAVAGTCRYHGNPQRLRTPTRQRGAPRTHHPFARPHRDGFHYAPRSSNARDQPWKS